MNERGFYSFGPYPFVHIFSPSVFLLIKYIFLFSTIIIKCLVEKDLVPLVKPIKLGIQPLADALSVTDPSVKRSDPDLVLLLAGPLLVEVDVEADTVKTEVGDV